MHNLPFISKLILGTGNFINSNIQGVLFAAVLSAVLAVYGFSNRNIRTKLIKLLGRLPIVRNLILQTELSNVFVSLSNLLEGGVDITKAFRISSQNLENEELKSLMQLTTEGLKKGETISRNWGTSSIIPQDIIPLITVAEKTATLPEVFNNLGDRLLNQFKDTVSRFLSILEPVIIVFLGLFIGVIIVAIMLAIVSLSDVGI
jgi:type II secretory pathway component PulF